MGMRLRRNVYSLPTNDPILIWYGKAVTAMRALPSSNPNSWTYQANIHGTLKAPPKALQKLWAKCQHGSSFFLPWHRMYLLHFERIVARHVRNLNGPADWALPYWDYNKKDAWRVLPAAFRAKTLDDGTPNPLFLDERDPDINAGQPVDAKYIELKSAMKADGGTGLSGFFGPPPPNHAAQTFGAVESSPHNGVHVAVGGDDGLMADPRTAAQDPIFWLHHANIDRLWQVWLLRDPEHHANLATPYWLTGVSFAFHDENGAILKMTSQDVLDMTKPPLEYSYEDTSDPLAADKKPPKPVPQHELVGATLAPTSLTDSVAHVSVPTPVTPQKFAAMRAPAGAAFAPGAPAKPQRVTLQLEHVTSQNATAVYDVYLNVPDDADPTQHEDRFVGRATLFGVAEASKPDSSHGGGGVNVPFDITELYDDLTAKGAVDLAALKVSFVPIKGKAAVPVQIGRISLYFA